MIRDQDWRSLISRSFDSLKHDIPPTKSKSSAWRHDRPIFNRPKVCKSYLQRHHFIKTIQVWNSQNSIFRPKISPIYLSNKIEIRTFLRSDVLMLQRIYKGLDREKTWFLLTEKRFRGVTGMAYSRIISRYFSHRPHGHFSITNQWMWSRNSAQHVPHFFFTLNIFRHFSCKMNFCYMLLVSFSANWQLATFS